MKFPAFYKTTGSLPYSRKYAIGTYPLPDEFSPDSHNHFFNIYFKIIPPFKTKTSK